MARSNTLDGLDRWFESVSTRTNEDARRLGTDSEYAPSEYVSPAIDLVEHDGEFVVFVDLPGVDPDAVDVRFEGQELTVAAERTDAFDDGEATVIARERTLAPAARTVTFPEYVDPTDASATMEHGELTVTVRKIPSDAGVYHIDVA